jgi:hypothetical protein
MYAGWVPDNTLSKKQWRRFGMGGEMIHSAEKRVYEYCDLTPEVLQRMIDAGLITNPMSWTAYDADTDVQLPPERQLWGGAGIQV